MILKFLTYFLFILFYFYFPSQESCMNENLIIIYYSQKYIFLFYFIQRKWLIKKIILYNIIEKKCTNSQFFFKVAPPRKTSHWTLHYLIWKLDNFLYKWKRKNHMFTVYLLYLLKRVHVLISGQKSRKLQIKIMWQYSVLFDERWDLYCKTL